MLTHKQERIFDIMENLLGTGLNEKDIVLLAEVIDNQDLYNLDEKYLPAKFAATIAENKNVAFRRTFGRNAVIYGPEGMAIIERDEVMYCIPYVKSIAPRTNFFKATRGHGNYIVYNNTTLEPIG